MMENKIKKVFLSSTSKDLSEYRTAVYKAISKLKGYNCVRMEDFGAVSEDSLSKCLKELKECDLFIGVVGFLYGSIPKGKVKSFTEIEYKTASKIHLPKLMFVTGEDFPLKANLRESDESWIKQKVFRSKVLSKLVIDKAESPDKLATNVVTAIHNHFRSKLNIIAPNDNYVSVFEFDKSTRIQIIEIKNNYWSSVYSPNEIMVIKKITFVRMSTKKLYSYDFTKGEIPEGVKFERNSSAENIKNSLSQTEIAEFDRPRFIEIEPNLFGLLIEPSSTNYIQKSQFTGKQKLYLLSNGEYTVKFEGTGVVEVRGDINIDLNPNVPITLQLSSEVKPELILSATDKVDHIQMEPGKIITSRIETNGPTVTRAGDRLMIDIREN